MKILKKINQWTAMAVFPLFVFLATNPAFATSCTTDGGTGGYDCSGSDAMDSMFSWIAGLLTGSGGKILAILALVASAATAIMGMYKTMIGFIAVLLITTVGPVVINSLYGMAW